jgi:16S rRNA (cytosine1402-N4)-methyltransferase
MKSVHLTVLLHESIDGLDIRPGDIYLDGTLGGGGHALLALEKTQGKLTVIGLDRDADALARSREALMKQSTPSSKLILKEANYRDLDKVLDDEGIPKVNRIMLDLGLSSDQFEVSRRGFSFQKDEPLVMTFAKDTEEGNLTAAYIVNNWAEESLADIIYGYGEERYARRIARGIVNYRIKKTIETTTELVEIIKGSVPATYRHGRIHPATKTFQALRITVNDELGSLKTGLQKGFERLENGGRLAVISFHSLEDRIVKHFYKEQEKLGLAEALTKKPIEASEEEEMENPRSRSAKLRILQKN